MHWIDSHCHLDASEFDTDRGAAALRARAAGVDRLVLPAVVPANFDAVRTLAHRHDAVYALGIHPLYVDRCGEGALARLAQALKDHAGDERLVAVGEIGLDHFVPGLDRARQMALYVEQLRLARQHDLPVILHVRRSADALLKGLRQVGAVGGIAHAFNGSEQQAQRFVDLGFCLGFGGALTFERALNLRRLACALPADALVLETDAPDMPPQWIYRTAQERLRLGPARNEPAELPRIAQTLAGLRGWSLAHTAAVTRANTCRVLPRLAALEAA